MSIEKLKPKIKKKISFSPGHNCYKCKSKAIGFAHVSKNPFHIFQFKAKPACSKHGAMTGYLVSRGAQTQG